MKKNLTKEKIENIVKDYEKIKSLRKTAQKYEMQPYEIMIIIKTYNALKPYLKEESFWEKVKNIFSVS